MLSSNDVVLAVMEGFEGDIQGRTLFQKVSYFVAAQMGIDVGYKAHYYGPYSSVIASTISELVMMGEVQEFHQANTNPFEGHDGDRKFYRYCITEDGNQASKIHRSWHPDLYEQAVQIARTIRNTNVDYMQLSFAAKIHYLLWQTDQDLFAMRAIQDAAKELGWPMTETDIHAGIEVLKKLGYVRESEG